MNDLSKTILLVEDDPVTNKMIHTFLTSLGYEVVAAGNGVEALSVLTSITPSLILSDIMMPQMDGYELRKRLLAREEFRLIPFIFLSAKGERDDVVRGYELIVDDYIVKPYDPKILSAKLHTLISKYENLTQLIRYDALTGLYNRRALHLFFKHELNRVRRYKQKLSVLMLDIDHFKRINDTYGHHFGDEVLKRIADCLLSQMREVDIIARYGGEEIIVLMPETNKTTAVRVADRLRKQISNLTFELEEVCVWVSGGIACAPDDGLEESVLVEAADRAMYRAKEGGRNQIRI